MTDNENWLPIPGYEGYYEVSDLGRIRSLDRVVPHARYGQQRCRGVVLTGKVNTQGRCQVDLHHPNRKAIRQVHCLVMEAFIGPCPAGSEVCHNNGDPLDNRLENLRYDTRKGNMADRRLHGTVPHQECCPNGHRRDEHDQYFWRGQRFCGTCRRGKIKRANARRSRAGA